MTPLPKPTPRFKVHGRVQAVSKSTPAQLRKEASDLCSRIVKRRDGRCLFKGLVWQGSDGTPAFDASAEVPCWGPLEAAHVWTRKSRPAVRFDPAAILTACHQHHAWGHAHEREWLNLCRNLIGPRRFDALEVRSLQTVKLDLQAVVDDLKRRAA
jgi:hypothetical protein